MRAGRNARPFSEKDFTMTKRKSPTNDMTTSDSRFETSTEPNGKTLDTSDAAEDRYLFERPPYEGEDDGGFDPTLMQSIQNDPCISKDDWSAVYRAARRGEPDWWLWVADDSEETEAKDE